MVLMAGEVGKPMVDSFDPDKDGGAARNRKSQDFYQRCSGSIPRYPHFSSFSL